MAIERQMYDLITWIMNVVFSSAIAMIFIPSLTLLFIIRFLLYSNAAARGEREEELRAEWDESTSLISARLQRARGRSVDDPDGPRRYERRLGGRRGRRW
jgi:hypothetical protein